MEDWTTLRRGGQAALVSALLAAACGPALAQTCTWGQPGYRSCVDAKIARQREQDAKGAPREVYRTAPANQRPGTLTPLPEPPSDLLIERPTVGATERRNAKRNQYNFDGNIYRMNRDAQRPLILPNPEVFPVPGRICPPGGC